MATVRDNCGLTPLIVCLTGMGRSGTSLMASYLHAAGINMGGDLIGPGKGNKLGHFEDREFVNFHSNLLWDNSCHLLLPKKSLSIAPERRGEGHGILNKRKKKLPKWGWKDPRSSLFLDYWADADSSVKFVLLYRDPDSVVDSLFRRDTDRCLKIMPWRAAEAWLRYNREILRFFLTHKSRAILINISGFNRHPNQGSSFIEDFLGTKIKINYSDVFNPDMISRPWLASKRIRTKLVSLFYLSEFEALYAEMERNATISSYTFDNAALGF